jgi:hypothetical protein
MCSQGTMCGHCAGFPGVPDPPGGVRFCTHCEDFIPIKEFPSGVRRFVCKAHMRASCKNSAQKMLQNPQKRALSKVWGRAYKDCRRFEQKGIGITQAEIDKLLTVSGADEIGDNFALYETLARGVAVVPVNPTKILCTSNAALVGISTRKLLLKQWRLFGKAEYCKLLKKEQSYLSMDPIENHSNSQGNSRSLPGT